MTVNLSRATRRRPGRRLRGGDLGDIVGKVPRPVPGIRPGSPEKIELMARRAARGEQLCHPAEPSLALKYTPRRVTETRRVDADVFRLLLDDMGDEQWF